MLYIERQPSLRSLLFLAALALVLYLGGLTLLEVRSSDEAFFAAMANDMVATGNFAKTHVYGRPVGAFPLYPWLTVLCSGFRAPSVFTLRLPAVLSLWVLAAIAGLFARRLQGVFAGTVAAAVILTCAVSFRVGSRAQAEILHTLCLSAAWFGWFYWGQERKRWHLAWAVAMFCLFLAVLAVGAKALFFFYFPMLFMRRALNLPHHLQSPAHISMLALFGLAVASWVLTIPNQPFLTWNTVLAATTSTVRPEISYLTGLITFPWKCLLYLVPWSLFVWTPFCLAYRQFEQNSIACRYLRTIIFSHALLFWLIPRATPLDLLPVFGPLAVLIGIHFEIVIRRYQHIFIRAVKAAAWCAAGLSVLGTIAWLGVCNDLFVIEGFPNAVAALCAILLLINAALLYSQLIRAEARRTFRSSLLWCITGFRVLSLCMAYMLFFWGHNDRYLTAKALAGLAPAETSPIKVETAKENQEKQDKQENQEKQEGHDNQEKQTIIEKQLVAEWLVEPAVQTNLADWAPKVDVIYLHSVPRELFLTVGFYLGKRLQLIENPGQELPADAETVLVLAPREPAVASRHWQPISPKVDMILRREFKYASPWHRESRLSEENKAVLHLAMLPKLQESNYKPKLFRLYAGTLK